MTGQIYPDNFNDDRRRLLTRLTSFVRELPGIKRRCDYGDGT